MNGDDGIYRASGKSPGGAGVRSSYRLIFQRCSQGRQPALPHSKLCFTVQYPSHSAKHPLQNYALILIHLASCPSAPPPCGLVTMTARLAGAEWPLA